MSWLLDTCAISEYAKKTPATKVISWLDEQDEASLFISVITLGELEKGIIKLRKTDPHRSQKLTAWLGTVEQRFAGRILPLDAATLHVCGRHGIGPAPHAGDGRLADGHRPMPRPHRGHPQRAGFRSVSANL